VFNYALASIAAGSALIAFGATASADPMLTNRNIDIQVSNDNGALFGDTPATYFINAPGGGLNQLHITTDSSVAGVAGQVTTQTTSSSSASGTFFASTTGGRGYNDDIILAVSLQGPIANDFAITIKSSGYQWTPSTAGVVNPIFKQDAVDETFNESDFLYGPQTAKPGPGNGFVLPFYSGQNINDPNTAQLLMFVDLDVGNDNIRTAENSGDAEVDFDVLGLLPSDILSFNVYAWAFSAEVADSSINWTNNLSVNAAAPGQSGYSVVDVPEPGTVSLLAAALISLMVLGSRRAAHSKTGCKQQA